jgi:hypothetical protein
LTSDAGRRAYNNSCVLVVLSIASSLPLTPSCTHSLPHSHLALTYRTPLTIATGAARHATHTRPICACAKHPTSDDAPAMPTIAVSPSGTLGWTRRSQSPAQLAAARHVTIQRHRSTRGNGGVFWASKLRCGSRVYARRTVQRRRWLLCHRRHRTGRANRHSGACHPVPWPPAAPEPPGKGREAAADAAADSGATWERWDSHTNRTWRVQPICAKILLGRLILIPLIWLVTQRRR